MAVTSGVRFTRRATAEFPAQIFAISSTRTSTAPSGAESLEHPDPNQSPAPSGRNMPVLADGHQTELESVFIHIYKDVSPPGCAERGEGGGMRADVKTMILQDSGITSSFQPVPLVFGLTNVVRKVANKVFDVGN